MSGHDSRDADLFGLFAADRRAHSSPTARESPAAFRASPARVRGHLTRGAILDKYRIESLLGTGGFAAVYRATHMLLRVPVAIKLLRPSVLLRDPGIARQLLDEARYAARINHPNVVRIHDVTHTDEITYIVMEYIEGRSLAKTVERSGPLAAADVVSLAIDVAEGLRAGLDEGLIHRDIKPANIVLTSSGRARIVDFGLAYAGSLRDGVEDKLGVGQVVGTRGYMAPEQVRNPRRVDFRADVYSLGITACHALTGASPSRSSEAALVRNVPPALQPLIRRMIATNPDDRPSSYEVLLSGLRQAARAVERAP